MVDCEWEAGISDQQRTSWNIFLEVLRNRKKKKMEQERSGFPGGCLAPILVYSPASVLNSWPVRVPNPEDLWSPPSAVPNMRTSLSQQLPHPMWSHRATEPHTYTEPDIHTGIYSEPSLLSTLVSVPSPPLSSATSVSLTCREEGSLC